MGASVQNQFSGAARRRHSNALVDQPGEEARVDDEIAKLSVKGGGRLGRNDLVARPALLLERRYFLANRDKHVAEFLELGPVAHRPTMTRNDDRIRRRRGEIGVA